MFEGLCEVISLTTLSVYFHSAICYVEKENAHRDNKDAARMLSNNFQTWSSAVVSDAQMLHASPTYMHGS